MNQTNTSGKICPKTDPIKEIPIQFYTRLNTAEALEVGFRWLKKLFILNVFFLLIMSLFRFTAFLVYGQPHQWHSDLLKALYMGVRFDAVILAYVAVIPALLLITTMHLKKESWFHFYPRLLRPYYLFFFALISFFLAVDIGYYSYFQDHINILVFGFIEDDTMALVQTFWKNYPVILYGFLSLILLLTYHWIIKQVLRPFVIRTRFEKIHTSVVSLVSVVLIALVFMIGRGSFGLFPLGPADTVISSDPFFNYLSTNGIHTFQRAIKLRKTQAKSWDMNMKAFGYSDPIQAFADFYQIPKDQVPADPTQLMLQKTGKNDWAMTTRPHVLLIMMESFGTYWLDFHSEQFNLMAGFEKHIQQDLFLKNFLPSANSTTGSLSSMMISSPKQPMGNFLTESDYLQVSFKTSPAQVYSKQGYETRFVYGGNPGWRDMNKFAKFQGFDHVEGDIDMKKSLGEFPETHDWGVYDEDVFRYVEKTLKEASKPQFILVMTTTNHPPYQVPKSYQPLPLEMPSNLKDQLIIDRELADSRFRTYQYSMQKLSSFLDMIKQSDLAGKTVIAVTGDHSFLPINFSDEMVFQKWSVPFYLYAPEGQIKLKDPEAFGSHMDILPTLYNLTLSEQEFYGLGVNLLDASATKWAFHDSGLVAGKEGATVVFGKDSARFLKWQKQENSSLSKLVNTEQSDLKIRMAEKYRSMMAILDYYLYSEKQNKK